MLDVRAFIEALVLDLKVNICLLLTIYVTLSRSVTSLSWVLAPACWELGGSGLSETEIVSPHTAQDVLQTLVRCPSSPHPPPASASPVQSQDKPDVQQPAQPAECMAWEAHAVSNFHKSANQRQSPECGASRPAVSEVRGQGRKPVALSPPLAQMSAPSQKFWVTQAGRVEP